MPLLALRAVKQTSGDKALVTATYSQRMRLRLADHSAVQSRIKGKKLRPVCGDRVLVTPIAGEDDWLITEILPRDNELNRPSARGKHEVLAANLTCLVVVAAAVPAPDWFIVDRYLAATEVMRTKAVLVFNKIDIEAAMPSITQALAEYEEIGYTVIQSSTKTGSGMPELEQLLVDQTGIIVGQSGVGKSSIINKLVSGAELRTASVSESRREGRHTTVNSEMIDLPAGGALIDSPGVRDYAPALRSTEDVANSFREIARHGNECRFANCRHLREPGCAVKQAIEDGEISARRYESYKRLLALTSRLTDGQY